MNNQTIEQEHEDSYEAAEENQSRFNDEVFNPTGSLDFDFDFGL